MNNPDEYYVMKVVLESGVFSLETLPEESELSNVYFSQEDAYEAIQSYGESACSYALIPAYVCMRDEKRTQEYLEGFNHEKP
jgi:predicted secreted protein